MTAWLMLLAAEATQPRTLLERLSPTQRAAVAAGMMVVLIAGIGLLVMVPLSGRWFRQWGTTRRAMRSPAAAFRPHAQDLTEPVVTGASQQETLVAIEPPPPTKVDPPREA